MNGSPPPKCIWNTCISASSSTSARDCSVVSSRGRRRPDDERQCTHAILQAAVISQVTVMGAESPPCRNRCEPRPFFCGIVSPSAAWPKEHVDAQYRPLQPVDHSSEIVVPENVQVRPCGELLSNTARDAELLWVDYLLLYVNIATLCQIV